MNAREKKNSKTRRLLGCDYSTINSRVYFTAYSCVRVSDYLLYNFQRNRPANAAKETERGQDFDNICGDLAIDRITWLSA